MPKILIADDDPHIREVVRFALEQAGMATALADNGQRALQLYAAEKPDALVLDIMMPELDGTEVCRELRKTTTVPIVFMSSRDDELDRILGLELGGDDYVTKPFSPRELVARVKAVLRRTQAPQAAAKDTAPTLLSHRDFTLDLERYEIRAGATVATLTATELGMLRTLMRRPGKVYNRDELIDGAHGDGHVISDRTVDSHMRRVRQKLGALGVDPIETVHGVGYRLKD